MEETEATGRWEKGGGRLRGGFGVAGAGEKKEVPFSNLAINWRYSIGTTQTTAADSPGFPYQLPLGGAATC